LTAIDKAALSAIGFTPTMIDNAGANAILGAATRPDPDHTETVRYNAFRGAPELQFGDPYIPKSILKTPYPERLLFVVRWIK
jgi:hypothetical protein